MTKDDLIIDIQKLGYSVRDSKTLLNMVLDLIKRGLVKDGKVLLPIGEITITKAPQERRMWRLNKIVTQYKESKRVKFKPKEDLDLEE